MLEVESKCTTRSFSNWVFGFRFRLQFIATGMITEINKFTPAAWAKAKAREKVLAQAA